MSDLKGVAGDEYRTIILPKLVEDGDQLHGVNQWTFMQDGAPPHTAKATRDMLHNICKDAHKGPNAWITDWPAQSFDLNPIENVWSAMSRYIQLKSPHCTNMTQFRAVVVEAWEQTAGNAAYRHKLIGSMRRRMDGVIKAKGARTKY